MPALKSRLDTRSEDFKANAAALRRQVDDLRATAAAVAESVLTRQSTFW